MAQTQPIHIKESRVGTFTEAASKHNMSPAEFQAHVLSHPSDFSGKMRAKAQFRKNMN